jgi:hypothetical protein
MELSVRGARIVRRSEAAPERRGAEHQERMRWS